MSFVDRCIWNATSAGTADFVQSSAVAGYQIMQAAGAVNGLTYGYAAQSSDLSQWEVGFGVWNSSTSTLQRTNVLYNSSGNTSKINFSAVPQIMITIVTEDPVNISAIAFEHANMGGQI